MNLLLVLREEAVCLFILLYLLAYSWKFSRENDFFLRLNLFGLGHVVFDIITIYTVNHLDTVPLWLNSVCHVLFYIFAILFCCELLCFVLGVVYGWKKPGRRRLAYLLPLAYLAATPFLRIDYLQGNGSNYSFGPCVFVGYSVAMVLFLSSEFILLRHFQKLEPNVKRTLVPGFVMMTIGVITQIFVPELLFTGAAVTLVTVGVFLSIANPMEKYRVRAFQDTCLCIKNRNAYTDAMQKYGVISPDVLLKRRFAIVGFDLFNLKQINDRFGHQVGDQYLRATADIIQAALSSAKGVYRTGGDEFAAIYLDTDPEVICRELAKVDPACADHDMGYEMPLGITHGYAVIQPGETVQDVERRADEELYVQKRKHYEKAEFDRRKR